MQSSLSKLINVNIIISKHYKSQEARTITLDEWMTQQKFVKVGKRYTTYNELSMNTHAKM